MQAKFVLSQTARCYLLIRAIVQEINGVKRPEKTKDYFIVSNSTVFQINVIAELRAPEALARSPIDKRFWYTHEREKFWLCRHCPTVRRTSAPLCKPL